MLPLLIAAGALLLLSGKKKGRKSSKRTPSPDDSGNGGVTGMLTALPGVVRDQGRVHRAPWPGGVIGAPWEDCQPPSGSPKGTYAAYSVDGKSCMVFWKPDTRAVAVSFLKTEFDKLSKSSQDELCASGSYRTAFVKRVVLLMFPQINPGSLPPPRSDDSRGINAPFFLRTVWAFTERAFEYEFCGFNPVT